MISTRILKASEGKREAHSIITIDDPCLSFELQLDQILSQYEELRNTLRPEMQPVFHRWFLSDSANQQALLNARFDFPSSIIEQPPLNLTKIALWVWMIEDTTVDNISDNRYEVEAFGYKHLFETGSIRPGTNPCDAMYSMLKATDKDLEKRGGSLLKSCARTWLFVRNIDTDYSDVVKGRNLAFNDLGLTTSTRFIASTGIGGRQGDSSAAVVLDSYSVLGLKEGRMRQINAPDHLNPTYEYGVAFERATRIDYDDRRHLFISGTASIDNKGRILWEGDIRRQTIRMWENVESLLSAASFQWENVGQILVYLRDPADYKVVKEMFEERFPDIPHLILHARVCRPGWLVEMECIAMRKI